MTYVLLEQLSEEQRGALLADGRACFDVEKKCWDFARMTQLLRKHFFFMSFIDNGEMLVYDRVRGVWLRDADAQVHSVIKWLTGDTGSRTLSQEVLWGLRYGASTHRDRFVLDDSFVNVRNGVLDITTFELLPHASCYYTLTQHPIVFDKTKDCPTIKKFLSEVLPEKRLQSFQEFVGYCLLRDTPYHVALMLVGSGSNGKSTLINLMAEFIGHENVSNVALQEFSKSRFASSRLYGKSLNLYADLSKEGLLDTGLFKQVTGGDTIEGEQKFQRPFKFKPYAKHVFSANNIPETADDSDAFYRRWLIIEFGRQFDTKSADPALLRKLTSQDELSGFLNWAIDGLKMLQERGYFEIDAISDTRKLYTRLSNPLSSFIDDCTDADNEAWIIKQTLYAAFVKYAKANKLLIYIPEIFSKKLPKLAEYVRSGQKRLDDDSRPTVWYGLKLKEDFMVPNRDSGIIPTSLTTSQDSGIIPTKPIMNQDSGIIPELTSVKQSSSGNEGQKNFVWDKKVMYKSENDETRQTCQAVKGCSLLLVSGNSSKSGILKLGNTLDGLTPMTETDRRAALIELLKFYGGEGVEVGNCFHYGKEIVEALIRDGVAAELKKGRLYIV